MRDAAYLGWGLSKGDGACPGAEGAPLGLGREEVKSLV